MNMLLKSAIRINKIPEYCHISLLWCSCVMFHGTPPLSLVLALDKGRCDVAVVLERRRGCAACLGFRFVFEMCVANREIRSSVSVRVKERPLVVRARKSRGKRTTAHSVLICPF
jgi:hypothetical protein